MPPLTTKQADELARLLKPNIEEFIQAHLKEYIAYLEEIAPKSKLAAQELACIKNEV
jgi:hypothetical protein